MDYGRDVVRDEMGFSYEPKLVDGEGIVDVRDARDNFFARVTYSPNDDYVIEVDGEYLVELDGGSSTETELQQEGLLEGLTVGKVNVADPQEKVLGTNNQVENCKTVTRAFNKTGKEELMFENIQDEDTKTLVSLTTSKDELPHQAQHIINSINPPALHSDQEDPYRQTWAPWSNSPVIQNRTNNRQETVQQAFETAINLTEDLLEPNKNKRR